VADFTDIRSWRVDKLKPFAKNSRLHSESQVSQIAASMREFGFTIPLLIDPEGEIIAGHGRLLAAQQLGMQEVPCVEVKGWSEAQKRAYRIADNKLTLNSEWDLSLLQAELTDLDLLGFDLDLTGFSEIERADLLADKNAGLTDPDDVPDVPQIATSELGDVWLLGRHRLVCGDSTNADAVAAALNGVKPHLMVTDPPYGVNYDAGWRNKAMPAKNDPSRWRDGSGRPIGQVMNDGRSDWSEAYALFPGDVAYVWHPAGATQMDFFKSLVACGFEIRMQIVWAKSQFPIGRGHYHVQHEPCWYAVRKGKTGHWSGDRKQSTLWQIDKPWKSETGHSTQKPVECMARPIRNNSSAGQAIYEPFSGSGTTIIACEQEGRACHAIELHPPYVDVAVTRWQQFTGQAAQLEQTGEDFEKVLARRHSENDPSPASHST
jgi:DNA modification methylase